MEKKVAHEEAVEHKNKTYLGLIITIEMEVSFIESFIWCG